MREHNIYRSTAFDDGSWVLNYRVLDVVGADVRGQFCSGSSTPFDLLHAIHKPLNFGYTAARIWNEVYVASGEGVLFGVGSFMFPRGSVYAANNYAPAGSVMNVYPGTYEEIVAPVVLNKRMTIRKWWGVPGLVVIKAK